MSLSVNELHFSIRTLNCLKNLDIKDIGELIQNSEKFLLRSPNFGRKSLFEVKNVLKDLNLKLTTQFYIENSPANIEKTAKEELGMIKKQPKKIIQNEK